MNNEPLVSIIIATYNQEKVIDETLQSVLRQTYCNLEIIVSDDGSRDGTRDELKRFAKKYPSIQLHLQEKNLGITDNFNFLAEKANGKYVSIFSGDDIMCAEKIESQVRILELNAAASFCHHAVFDLDADTNKVRGIISHRYEDGITTIHDILRNLGIPGSMSVMYRRSSARMPAFDPEIRTASDWLQLIHLAMAGQGFYIDTPLCYYRKDTEYNSKDTSKYEADFKKTIELTRAAYAKPGDAVDRSCDYALARYSLGAGFRCLLRGDNENARKFFAVNMPGIRLAIYSRILATVSYLHLGQWVLSRCKKIFKGMQHS